MFLRKRIKNLKEILKVQMNHGNWDYDPYMWGYANGLICAWNILNPYKHIGYLDEPKKWGEDKKRAGKKKT